MPQLGEILDQIFKTLGQDIRKGLETPDTVLKLRDGKETRCRTSKIISSNFLHSDHLDKDYLVHRCKIIIMCTNRVSRLIHKTLDNRKIRPYHLCSWEIQTSIKM
uniref:Uncharacterized protein n=1 Tax=Magallana gigas TaxID=29159 RepID=K1RDL9_MAGGI